MSYKAGEVYVTISAQDAEMRAGLDRAKSGLESFQREAQKVGTALTLGLTAPIVGASTAALKTSVDLNAAMASVATLIPGQLSTVEALKEEVKALAEETGKDAIDLADGLYQILSAFPEASDDTAFALEFLRVAAEASVAGLASTAETVGMLSAVIKGYSLEMDDAQHVSDLAFKTVVLGQTRFRELAHSMGHVIPMAAALNITQEELWGAMATLTGVTGDTNNVVTQLRGVFKAVLDPTDQMAVAIGQVSNALIDMGEMDPGHPLVLSYLGAQVELNQMWAELQRLEQAGAERSAIAQQEKAIKEQEKAVKAAGAALGAAIVETVGLQQTLTMLRDTTDGNNVQFANMLGRVEALNGALALTGPVSDALAWKTEAMASVMGSTAAAYGEQTSGINEFGFALKQAQQTLKSTVQELGDTLTPLATKLLDAFTPLLDVVRDAIAAFDNAPAPVKAFAGELLTLAAEAGPILLAVSGLGKLWSALGALFTGPTGWVVVGVALIAKFVAAWAEAREEEKKYYETQKAKAQAYEDEADRLEDLVNQYDKLAAGGATTRDELEKVATEIARIMPGISEGYESNAAAINASRSAILNYVDELRKMSAMELKIAAARATNEKVRLEAERERKRAERQEIYTEMQAIGKREDIEKKRLKNQQLRQRLDLLLIQQVDPAAHKRTYQQVTGEIDSIIRQVLPGRWQPKIAKTLAQETPGVISERNRKIDLVYDQLIKETLEYDKLDKRAENLTKELVNLNDAIKALDMTISAYNEAAERNPDVKKLARGGLLPGRSGPDQYPALLAPGEAVVPADAVWGGPEAVHEWFKRQGVPGFQSGGLVQPGATLMMLLRQVQEERAAIWQDMAVGRFPEWYEPFTDWLRRHGAVWEKPIHMGWQEWHDYLQPQLEAWEEGALTIDLTKSALRYASRDWLAEPRVHERGFPRPGLYAIEELLEWSMDDGLEAVRQVLGTYVPSDIIMGAGLSDWAPDLLQPHGIDAMVLALAALYEHGFTLQPGDIIDPDAVPDIPGMQVVGVALGRYTAAYPEEPHWLTIVHEQTHKWQNTMARWAELTGQRAPFLPYEVENQLVGYLLNAWEIEAMLAEHGARRIVAGVQGALGANEWLAEELESRLDALDLDIVSTFRDYLPEMGLAAGGIATSGNATLLDLLRQVQEARAETQPLFETWGMSDEDYAEWYWDYFARLSELGEDWTVHPTVHPFGFPHMGIDIPNIVGTDRQIQTAMELAAIVDNYWPVSLLIGQGVDYRFDGSGPEEWGDSPPYVFGDYGPFPSYEQSGVVQRRLMELGLGGAPTQDDVEVAALLLAAAYRHRFWVSEFDQLVEDMPGVGWTSEVGPARATYPEARAEDMWAEVVAHENAHVWQVAASEFADAMGIPAHMLLGGAEKMRAQTYDMVYELEARMVEMGFHRALQFTKALVDAGAGANLFSLLEEMGPYLGVSGQDIIDAYREHTPWVGFAGGGLTEDLIPALVAPGEAIVPRDVVGAGWPAIAAWFREQGVPGFAAGGIVADTLDTGGRQSMWTRLQTEFLKAAEMAKETFADIREAAIRNMPILSDALRAAEQAAPGGPEAMAVAVISAVIQHSETFAGLLDRVNPLLQAAADALGMVLSPMLPLVTVLSATLTPVLQVIGTILAGVVTPAMQALFPVLKGFGLVVIKVAQVMAWAWNALADAVNQALGWLGVDISMIDTGGLQEAFDALQGLTWEQAMAVEAVNGALGNVPSGFKAALRRWEAASPTGPSNYSWGAGPSGGAGAQAAAAIRSVNVTITGDVYGWEDFKRKVREATAEGDRSLRLAQYGTV